MWKKKRGLLAILKDHFIPHHGNDHLPQALRHKALFTYSLGLITLKVMLVSAQILLPSASLYSSSITRANIIELTNASRRGAGLETLATNSLLNGAAQAKAEDIILNQYFAHTSPSGKTPWIFIRSMGYDYVVAGENLAIYYTEAEDVTAGWLASPSHKANIMDARFIETGVGVARGTFDGYENSIVVVQMFGLPVAGPILESEPEENIDPAAAEVFDLEDVTTPSIPPSETEVATVAMTDEGIEVEVTAPGAEEVFITLNEANVALYSDGTGKWYGNIDDDAVFGDPDGAELFVHIEDEGETQTEAVAWVAGTTDSRDVFYVDGAERSAYLFGTIKLGGLEDVVKQIFILTMTLLAAALLASVMIKFERQHHSVTAHALVVIILAGFLAFV